MSSHIVYCHTSSLETSFAPSDVVSFPVLRLVAGQSDYDRILIMTGLEPVIGDTFS
jgi:hypothetical protein